MATTTRTSAPRTRTTAAKTTPRKPSAKTSVQKATDEVSDSAGSLVDAVKARPLASAAIAAGVAGAGALIWSKRGKIADQASALGDKAAALGGKIGDQATALSDRVSERAGVVGEKISDQATAIGDKVNERFGSATDNEAKTQQEIAEEALSLKQSVDPVVTEQSKVGAVAY